MIDAAKALSHHGLECGSLRGKHAFLCSSLMGNACSSRPSPSIAESTRQDMTRD